MDEFEKTHRAAIASIAECELSCKMVSRIVDNSQQPIPFVFADAPFSRASAPALSDAMRGLSCGEAAAVAFSGWLACRRVQNVRCQRLMLVLCAREAGCAAPEALVRRRAIVEAFEQGEWGEKASDERRSPSPPPPDFTEQSPEVLRVLGALRSMRSDECEGIDAGALWEKHQCVMEWLEENGVIYTTVDDDHVELTERAET